MKNILIIETDRDNSGSGIGFVETLDEVKDENLRTALETALTFKGVGDKKILKSTERWGKSLAAGELSIVSTGFGYVFNEYRKELPYTVEHIVDHIIC